MKKTIVHSNNAPDPLGHYSQAIVCSRNIFTSGQLGIHAGSRLMAGSDIEAQARAALDNVRSVLNEVGLDLDSVSKCSVFLKDLGDLEKLDEIFCEYFPCEPPARTVMLTTVGTGMKVEIEIVASQNSDKNGPRVSSPDKIPGKGEQMPRTVIFTDRAPSPIGPYSQAIQLENIVFTAGQTGLLPGTRDLVGTDIESQTRQTLENIKAILEAAGCSLDQVVKCLVFIANIDDFGAMNKVYSEFFPKDSPARSTVQAALMGGAKVEIEAIAIR